MYPSSLVSGRLRLVLLLVLLFFSPLAIHATPARHAAPTGAPTLSPASALPSPAATTSAPQPTLAILP